ncbi:hypothetical protein AB4Z46_28450 [Variovorax sp. M-6]|uniref:hypothetical protein n=1 Tax=Variovorax sp. M-6 TaxID=3233041 RepID=UPI003F9EB04E
MRHILTSDARVEQLRKEAKRHQRKHGGKYTEALDKVAKKANYDHWHHVTLCAGESERAKAYPELDKIFDSAIEAAKRGEATVASTSGEHGVGPYVLFSSESGDAWLLDPDGFGAMCLIWKGKMPEEGAAGAARREETGWHAECELLGDFFRVESELPDIGEQAIAGYPVDEIRAAIADAMSTETKMLMTIGRAGAVDLTPDVIARMKERGMSDEELLRMKAEGFLYSPARDTLISPPMTNEDFEDSDFDEDELARP